MNQEEYKEALKKVLEPLGFKLEFDSEYNVCFTHPECEEFYLNFYWKSKYPSMQYSHRDLNDLLIEIIKEIYIAGMHYESDNHRCR